jgi:hypothetical protein
VTRGAGADESRRIAARRPATPAAVAPARAGHAGDDAAFAVLFQRHHQELYRFCRSILRHEEDARDAVQSAMTKAFAALQTEERDFELRPWLFRIAHNEAISILRARRPAEDLDAVPTRARTRWSRRWPTASGWRSCAPTCWTCRRASARRSSCASSAA